jgi:very-short-patch-repair endonuclease
MPKAKSIPSLPDGSNVTDYHHASRRKNIPSAGLVIDSTCVRRETRVFTPLNPPVNGGTLSGLELGLTPSPLTGRAGEGPASPLTNAAGVGPAPSPLTNAAGVGPAPSPLTGRAGEEPLINLIPIESLQPGDLVLAHDGSPRRVLRVIHRLHRGEMVGIRHPRASRTLWVTGDHFILCQKRTLSYGADRSWRHIPKEHFQRARQLRREMTPSERRLWRALRAEQLGVKFRKQHPIGAYITDFYSFEAGLVIEVDGSSHFTAEAQEYDRERDAYLSSLGLTVLRFTNQDVSSHEEQVVNRIADTIATVRASEDPYQQWRRADSLRIGDMIYFGANGEPIEISDLLCEVAEEEVYDLEVEGAHSFITEVCAVHNSGSGTTSRVASTC